MTADHTDAPQSLKNRWFDWLRPDELRPVRSLMTHGYRPDVDGMRALAVLPVMLFHGGLGIFSGGFIGVDIFFVISGFLIGRIILGEVERGSFSILNFYDRRVRRIIPPLLSVVAASLVASYFLLPPRQYEGLGLEALTAMAFVSNIWFWQQAGYFHPEATTQPLLHTWSLANEEQFYLFFPAAILALKLLSQKLIVPAIVAVLILSFALSAWAVVHYPSAAFFLLPTRAWELMLGCLLASGALPRPRSTSQASWAVTAGIMLMLAPVFTFTEDMGFPGAVAAVPTLGTALAIWGGQIENRSSATLSARPLVFVGLLSYSLYLWHWPIYVLMRYAGASYALSMFQLVIGMALTFTCAILSVRLIEGPLRDRQTFPARRLYSIILPVVAAVGCLAALIVRGNGMPARFDGPSRSFAAGSDDFSPRMKGCIDLPADQLLDSCGLGVPGRATFLVWGDSHGAAVAGAIDTVARQAGRSGLLATGAGCFPTFGPGPPDATPIDRRRCERRSTETQRLLAGHPEIDTVILMSRWHRGGQTPPHQVVDALVRTVNGFHASGRRVIVLGGVPIPDGDVPWTLATASHMRRPLPPFVHRIEDGTFYATLRRLDADKRIRYISLAPPFCAGLDCAAALDGRSLFTDDNHISEFAGQRLVAPYLQREKLFGR